MWLAILVSCSLPVEQRESCARYVECIAARDLRDGTTTDVVRFAEGGDCWGGVDGADLCDRACVSGLTYLAEREPDLAPACSP